MGTPRKIRGTAVLLLLAGCTSNTNPGNSPDGGGAGSGGTAGVGLGSGGRGGQAGGLSGPGGTHTDGVGGGVAGNGGASAGSGGGTGLAGSGAGGSVGNGGAGQDGSAGAGAAGDSAGTGGRGGADGTAGTTGIAGADGGGAGGDGGGADGDGSFNCAPCPAPLSCRGGGVDDTCGYTSTSPAGKVCSPDRWCFVMPVPQGNHLNSVFTVSPTDVWAAGDDATIIHWDGSSWSGTSGLFAGGTGANAPTFYSVWASSPGDIWLAGTTGTAPLLMRGDGTHWNLVSVPTTGKNRTRFQGIWGTGPNDVWIGGWLNGSLYHWDGAGWARAVYSDDGATYVRYVTGMAKNDLYVYAERLLHFDGSTFTPVTGASDGISGVWAMPGAGVWASEDGLGRLWHLVGSTWVSYQIPNGYDVKAVWGDSPTSLWVAGDYRITVTTPALWRFNGTWTMIPQAAYAGARAISGPTNKSDAIAVGSFGQIDLLTGATSVENPYVGSVNYDVQGTSSSNVWLAGGPNFRATHWDGTGLTDYVMGGNGSYTAVGVSPGGDVWTATSNVSYKLNGTKFAAQTGLSGVTPNSFWAPQNDSIWVTTGTNAVYNWTGSSWQTVAHALAGSSATFQAIWGVSPTNVWLVGSAGITQHYDGASWTPYTTPDSSGNLMGVWGWDATHALAASSNGVIYSWKGQQWVQTYSVASGGFGRIHGCSVNDVWAVRTDASRIDHYDGANWSESATGLAVPGASILCASPGDVWMTGSLSNYLYGGAVLRRQ